MAINASGLYSSTAFKDKVVGITGAAGGIGRATVRLLGELGASVLMMDMNEEKLMAFEKQMLDQGVDVKAVVTDVGVREDLARAVDALKQRWGKVDGWVNNAGLNIGEEIEEQPEEDFIRCWEVNTLAAWRSLKLTLGLFPQTGGAIVNISSILSSRTRPHNMAYTSSKAALEGLTRCMAVELAPRKIRANCVIPGSIYVQATTQDLMQRPTPPTEVELNDAKYFEQYGMFAQPWTPWRGPEDVANLIIYLLSNASPYVTGTSMFIDGALNAELRTIGEVDYDVFHNELTPLMELRKVRVESTKAKLQAMKQSRKNRSS